MVAGDNLESAADLLGLMNSAAPGQRKGTAVKLNKLDAQATEMFDRGLGQRLKKSFLPEAGDYSRASTFSARAFDLFILVA